VAVDNCSEQVVNQNTNVVVEVCKIARKRTSGVNSIKHPQVQPTSEAIVSEVKNNSYTCKPHLQMFC